MEDKKINDGGKAFPSVELNQQGDVYDQHLGMSLRDYFATKAPTPDASDVEHEQRQDRARNPYNEPHKAAIRSRLEIECGLRYKWADAMIEARSKQ